MLKDPYLDYIDEHNYNALNSLERDLHKQLKKELKRELSFLKEYSNKEFPLASELILNSNEAINNDQLLIDNLIKDIANRLRIKSSIGEFKLIYHYNFSHTSFDVINKISSFLKEKGYKGTISKDKIEISWQE